MRNLLIFLTRYNAFFFFFIFEAISLVIYIKYNSFQKATFINSANVVTGSIYEKVNGVYDYLSLDKVNDSLARENAKLRSQLKSSFYIDTVAKHKLNDTVLKQQYVYIAARVINNSTNHSYNYITINRGALDSISVGNGVICNAGIVGKVIAVSPHMAIVQSMLSKSSRFSVILAKNHEIGSAEWGDGFDIKKGLLVDVSTNAQPKLGESVITSGYGIFPKGTMVGRVSDLHPKNGGISLSMGITFSVDYDKLEYVNVVINHYQSEQDNLEATQKKNDQDNNH